MMTVASEQIKSFFTSGWTWKKAAGVAFGVLVGYRVAHYLWRRTLGPPRCVVILSGKRKCGKDYLTERLMERLGIYADVVRLSGPLKKQYALENGLDYEELLSDSTYKEKYRHHMILWGEEKRNADPGFFCRLATENRTADVWIVSDARRRTDIEYFKARYPTYVVRISSSEDVRQQRGWVFTAGVDDVESECGLDDYHFDQVIVNNGLDGISPKVDRALQRVIVRAMADVFQRKA